jgi:hypothetical protein
MTGPLRIIEDELKGRSPFHIKDGEVIAFAGTVDDFNICNETLYAYIKIGSGIHEIVINLDNVPFTKEFENYCKKRYEYRDEDPVYFIRNVDGAYLCKNGGMYTFYNKTEFNDNLPFSPAMWFSSAKAEEVRDALPLKLKYGSFVRKILTTDHP